MNNQVKLIDTEKTLEWFIQHLDPFHVERFREAINRGILAPTIQRERRTQRKIS